MTVADRTEAGLAVLLTVGIFVAATPALGAYRVGGAGLVVAAAATGGVLIPFCGVRLGRLTPVASYGLSLAGLLVLLLVADGPHPTAVARAVAEGPNRIVTETLPLSGGRAALSALVVLVWVCGAAGGEAAARAAGRRHASLALVAPVLLYAVCFAVASSAPERPRYGGAVMLVCLAAAAAVIHHRSQPPAEAPEPDPGDARHGWLRGPAAAGVVVASVVAAVLALVAPDLPGWRASPAALHRPSPTDLPVLTDPVDSMAQLRDGDPARPPVPELTVALSKPSNGYLAAGYLDLYDGGQWRFSADFQPTGGRIPERPGAVASVSSAQVTQRVVVTGDLPVPLLPALDRPSSVTGVAVGADAATGMLLPQSRATEAAYTVDSGAPSSTLAGLPAADAIDQSVVLSGDSSEVELPPGTTDYLATTVRFLAALTGERPGGNVAFLQGALQALHAKDKRLAPAGIGNGGDRAATTTTLVPSGGRGTSLSEVINAVTVQRAATPEQFATFYAMVARYLGVPARVVTGFRLAGDDSGRPLAAGRYQVTNREAWAWVEIPVAGLGWVVCDPTPDATTAAAAPAESVAAPTPTVPPRQADAVPRNQATGAHALAQPGHLRLNGRTHTSLWALFAVVGGGLIMLIAVAGPGQAWLRRCIRRRRRLSPDPAELAVGAWLELLDGLERAGMRASPCATASEVVAEAGYHFGTEAVPTARVVAAAADEAVFSSAPGLPREAAVQAWKSSQELNRHALRGLETGQRIRSLFVVGSAPSRPGGRAG